MWDVGPESGIKDKSELWDNKILGQVFMRVTRVWIPSKEGYPTTRGVVGVNTRRGIEAPQLVGTNVLQSNVIEKEE